MTTRTETKIAFVGKTAPVAYSAVKEGAEFIDFDTGADALNSSWINPLQFTFTDTAGTGFLPLEPITLRSQTLRGSRYGIEFEPLILNANDKTGKRINQPFLTRSDYVTLFSDLLSASGSKTPTSHTVKILSSVDQGKLVANGQAIKGVHKITATVEWPDPSNAARTLHAPMRVTTRYTGSKLGITSSCCALKSGDSDTATADTNDRQSNDFLNATKLIPGVQTTSSGLQYLILQSGTGAAPTSSNTVAVNYRGFLPSGKVFDSNVRASFKLSSLIAGWSEGLQLMTPGAKFRFYIPSNLAYGLNGADKIGPNAALVFDVELIGITQ